MATRKRKVRQIRKVRESFKQQVKYLSKPAENKNIKTTDQMTLTNHNEANNKIRPVIDLAARC